MSSHNQKVNTELVGAFLLFGAAVLAIVVKNSSLHTYYHLLETTEGYIGIGQFMLKKNIVHWVNDGLMALYFLLVGLEIKREVVAGTLSNKANIIIPSLVAFCGLLVPAIIYIAINITHPQYLNGWAIPTTTDIAFTLGIIALLGSRVPLQLRILVTTIAIFDDIAAIVIIALFYSHSLSPLALILAGLCLGGLIIINRLRITHLSPYIVLGGMLWVCVLESGVHATLAGVAIAMCIPHHREKSLLVQLENTMTPWVIFLVVPLFAFANAGISFEGFSFNMFFNPITLGIMLGLFVGKQIGIFSSLWLFSKTSYFNLGRNLTTAQLYGIGMVCGIGFTMSLFIGTLAFESTLKTNAVKIGVLSGSLLSGLFGYLLLKYSLSGRQAAAPEATQ